MNIKDKSSQKENNSLWSKHLGSRIPDAEGSITTSKFCETIAPEEPSITTTTKTTKTSLSSSPSPLSQHVFSSVFPGHGRIFLGWKALLSWRVLIGRLATLLGLNCKNASCNNRQGHRRPLLWPNARKCPAKRPLFPRLPVVPLENRVVAWISLLSAFSFGLKKKSKWNSSLSSWSYVSRKRK